jgi:hypothetical protein
VPSIAYDAIDRRGTEEMRSMSGWSSDDLDRIEAADELEIASVGRDGGLRKRTTIWVVRLGNDLFVLSVNGRAAAWFRGTQVRHEGRSSASGLTKDVTFVDAEATSKSRSTTRIAASIAAIPRASSAVC